MLDSVLALRNPVSGGDVLAAVIVVPLSLLGGWHLGRLAYDKICWFPSRGHWRVVMATRVPGHLTAAQVAQMGAKTSITFAMGKTTMHPTGRPMLDPDSVVALMPGRLEGTPVDPQVTLACYTPGSTAVLPAPTTGQVHRGWEAYADYVLPPKYELPISIAQVATAADVQDALDLYAFQMRPQPKVDSVIYAVMQRYYPACAAEPGRAECKTLMDLLRPAAELAIQQFG